MHFICNSKTAQRPVVNLMSFRVFQSYSNDALFQPRGRATPDLTTCSFAMLLRTHDIKERLITLYRHMSTGTTRNVIYYVDDIVTGGIFSC